MVIKPTGMNFEFDKKKESQMNGVAVFIFLLSDDDFNWHNELDVHRRRQSSLDYC